MLDAGADLATAAELVVTLGSFSRADLAIIATISASSHQIKLIARRSAGVTAPSQLRGKRVGTVQKMLCPVSQSHTPGATRKHRVDCLTTLGQGDAIRGDDSVEGHRFSRCLRHHRLATRPLRQQYGNSCEPRNKKSAGANWRRRGSASACPSRRGR